MESAFIREQVGKQCDPVQDRSETKNSARRRNFSFCLSGSFPQTQIIEDFIFGRTDNPKGTHYENHVNIEMNDPEMTRFVEMCFDPGSAMNERLKETLVQMLSEVGEK